MQQPREYEAEPHAIGTPRPPANRRWQRTSRRGRQRPRRRSGTIDICAAAQRRPWEAWVTGFLAAVLALGIEGVSWPRCCSQRQDRFGPSGSRWPESRSTTPCWSPPPRAAGRNAKALSIRG